MMEKTKNILEKLAKEELDTELLFDGCEIIVNDKKITLEGNLNLEIKEK